jgi:hypothetical protein
MEEVRVDQKPDEVIVKMPPTSDFAFIDMSKVPEGMSIAEYLESQYEIIIEKAINNSPPKLI